jgi:hypothetical protein
MNETILPQIKSLKPLWSCYLKDHKKPLAVSLIFLILVLWLFAQFVQYVERRDGFTFTDPVLEIFSPIDLTWLIFVLIYSSLVIAIIHLLDKPRLLHLAVLTYAILVSIRMGAMYLLPLNPPESTIILNDPFVQLFGSTGALTKDLFFSGHTATLFMLYLVSRQKVIKRIFLVGTVLVGLCVLLQHLHYTVDVFVAPFMAFTAYSASKRILSP